MPFNLFKRDFMQDLEQYSDIEYHLAVLPEDGVKSDIASAQQLLASIYGLDSTVFLGFFASAKTAFLYVAAQPSTANAVIHEIMARYPGVSFEKVLIDRITSEIAPFAQLPTLAVLAGQVYEDKWWRPLHISSNFAADPIASLLAIASRLKSEEAIWWVMAIRAGGVGTQHPAYDAMVEVLRMGGGDADLRASIQKMEQSLFYVQMFELVIGRDISALLSAFDSFLGQFRSSHNAMGLAEKFYGVYKNNLQTSQKLIQVVLQHNTISFDKHPDAWMILSLPELAGMWHIPNDSCSLPAQMLKYDPDELVQRQQVEQIASQLPDNGILIGHLAGDTSRSVTLDEACRYTPCFIVGAAGMGKSALLANMIQQDMLQGNGLALIDPAGDLVETVLRLVPPHRIDDIVLVDVGDADFAVGLNLLHVNDVNNYQERELIKHSFVELIHRLEAEQPIGPKADTVLDIALGVLTQCPDSSLIELDLFLNDRPRDKRYLYQENVFVQSGDFILQRDWENLSGSQKGEAAQILNSRLQFLRNPLVRTIVGQSKSALNIRDIMDRRKILLINISQGRIGAQTTQLFGAMITSQILSAAFSRVDMPESERVPFYLYVDEFQNFVTPAFAESMDQARKFGLRLVMANQRLSQLTSYGILDSIKTNAQNVIAFRVSADDGIVIKKWFRDGSYQEMTEQYHACVQLYVNQKVLPALHVSTSVYPQGQDATMPEQIRTIARSKYARPRREVEAEIKRKYQETYSTYSKA